MILFRQHKIYTNNTNVVIIWLILIRKFSITHVSTTVIPTVVGEIDLHRHSEHLSCMWASLEVANEAFLISSRGGDDPPWKASC